MMPFVFVFAKCGNPIYVDDGNFLLYGASSRGEPYTLLDRVHERLNGHCPKCGRKLNSLPLNVQVKPTAHTTLQNSLLSYLQLLTVANYLPTKTNYKTNQNNHQNNKKENSK
jgi:hypothetical protein